MKRSIVVFFALGLAACSSKLAYNNLDWLVYWYMDDYVELNDQQEAIFDKSLNQWIDWHRSDELPKYIAHLNAVREDIANDALDVSRAQYHFARATEHWHRLRNELSPTLASLASRLDQEQVVRLFAALEKDNKEDEEDIKENAKLSAQEKLDKRIDSIQDDFEERMGELTDEQEALIRSFAPKFKPINSLWLDYRRDLQQRARRLFVLKDQDKAAFERDLENLLINPEQYRSDAFKAASNHNRELDAQLIAGMASTLTPEQKAHVLDSLDELIADLKELQE